MKAIEPQETEFQKIRTRAMNLTNYMKADSLQVALADSVAEISRLTTDTILAKWYRIVELRLRMDNASARKQLDQFIQYAEQAEVLYLELDEIERYSYIMKMESNRLFNHGYSNEAQLKVDTLWQIARQTDNKTALYYSMYSQAELVNSVDKPAGQVLYRQAADCCEKYLHDNNLLNQSYSRIGKYYLEIERWDSLIYWSNKMLKVQPEGNWRALYFKGEGLFKTRQWEEFRKTLYDDILPHKHEMPTFEAYLCTILEIFNLVTEGNQEAALELCRKEARSHSNRVALENTIYEYSCDWENAYKTLKQVASHKDSIRMDMNRKQLQTVYASIEATYQTKEQAERIKFQRYMMIGCVAIIIICLVFIEIVAYQKRQVKRMNNALAQRITDILHNKEGHQYTYEEHTTIADSSTPEAEDDLHKQVRLYIEEMKQNNRFCNPNFDRNELISELHLHKRNFSKDFESVTGESIPKFLTRIRMEYAAEQILSHSEYTLEAIAQSCGISSRATFYRNFTERFGISPADYRAYVSSKGQKEQKE